MLASCTARRLLPLRPYVPSFRRWNSDAVSGNGTSDARSTSDINTSVSDASNINDSEFTSSSNAPEVGSSSDSSPGTSSPSSGFTSFSQSEIIRSDSNHRKFQVTAEEWNMLMAVVHEHKKRINDLEFVARGQEAQRKRLMKQLEQREKRIKTLEDASKELEQRATQIKTLEDASKEFIEHVQIPIHLMLLSRHAYRVVTDTPRPSWRRLKREQPLSKELSAQESPNIDSSAEGSEAAKSHGKPTATDTSEATVAQAAEENENAQNRGNSTKVNNTFEATTEKSVQTTEASELPKGFHVAKGEDEDPFKDPQEVAKKMRKFKDRYERLGFQRANDVVRLASSVSK
jgi:hypothetical protein